MSNERRAAECGLGPVCSVSRGEALSFSLSELNEDALAESHGGSPKS